MIRLALSIVFLVALANCQNIQDNDAKQMKNIRNDITQKLKKFEQITPSLSVSRGGTLMKLAALSSENETRIFPAEFVSSFEAYGRQWKLRLRKNSELIAENYVEFSVSDGKLIEHRGEHDDINCYYHGEVDGDESGYATVSMCSGLHGVVSGHGEQFNIAPATIHTESRFATLSHGSDHVVFRDADVNEELPASLCGTEMSQPIIQARSRSTLLDKTTRTVELLIVNDQARARALGARTEADSLSLWNVASQYYRAAPFGAPLQVVVVGQVTFRNGDPYTVIQTGTGIEVTGSSGLLDVFNSYRGRVQNWPKHDSAQLMSSLTFRDGIRGLANVGSICSYNGGHICQMTSPSPSVNSMIAAHELGHTLGMLHDGVGNACPSQGFIMQTTTSTASRFSTCSLGYESQLAQGGGMACLSTRTSSSSSSHSIVTPPAAAVADIIPALPVSASDGQRKEHGDESSQSRAGQQQAAETGTMSNTRVTYLVFGLVLAAGAAGAMVGIACFFLVKWLWTDRRSFEVTTVTVESVRTVPVPASTNSGDCSTRQAMVEVHQLTRSQVVKPQPTPADVEIVQQA